MKTKVCKYCELEFIPPRIDAVFCDKNCRYAYNAANRKSQVTNPPMSETQALVNAYLMDRSLEDLDELIHDRFKRKVVR